MKGHPFLVWNLPKNSSMFSFLFIIAVGSAIGEDLPKVAFSNCQGVGGSSEYFKCMKIQYGNGHVKVARLNKVDGFDTVLSGDIVGEADTHVSVSVLNEYIEVMIVSQKDGIMMFKYNVKTGESSDDSFPDDGKHHIDGKVTTTNRSSTQPGKRFLVSRALPRQGMNMKVQVLYDRQFKARFGSDVQLRISAVFNHVKNFFLLDSLGTKLYLERVGTAFVAQSFYAGRDSDLE